MSEMTTPPAEAPPTRSRWRLPSFSVQVLLALAIGVLLGLAATAIGKPSDGSDNWLTQTLHTVGSTYVQLLTMVVPPLVFTALVVSVVNLRKVTNAARLAVKTLLWFSITALIAVTIGIVLGVFTKPGAHSSVDMSTAAQPTHTGSWLDFLNSLIPANFLGLTASTSTDAGGAVTASLSFNVLQIVVLAILVGIAALKVGAKAEPFIHFTESLLAIVQKVLWWIIRLSPLGTLGLIGYAVAGYGWGLLAPLGLFAVDIYIGLALVLLVVYPILLRTNGLGVRQFFRGAWPAIQLAFVSRSSVGTMPVTERVTERNLGVPREYASFAVPLGSTVKMDGCAAIYPALAAIFIAEVFGVHLTIADYLLIVFVAVIGSAATAGMTGAVVMLTLTLSTLGLPLEGVGLLMAIDPILDMGRTAINVAGQALVPLIVAKRERILDMDRYVAASSRELFADDGAARPPQAVSGPEGAGGPEGGSAPSADSPSPVGAGIGGDSDPEPAVRQTAV